MEKTNAVKVWQKVSISGSTPRLLRGGSWNNLRSANRNTPDNRNNNRPCLSYTGTAHSYFGMIKMHNVQRATLCMVVFV